MCRPDDFSPYHFLEVGEIVKWYPGESDYPSIVKIFEYTENGVLVNYANDPIEENWIVQEDELVMMKR